MINYRDKARFYNEFGTLLDAGMPLTQSLSLLKITSLQESIADINTRVIRGSSLSNAILKNKRSFSVLEQGVIAMGEEAGKLVACCKNLAHWFEVLAKLKAEFLSSLWYPALIIHLAPIITGLPALVSSGCFSCYLSGTLLALAPFYLSFIFLFWGLPLLRKGESPLAKQMDKLLLKIPLFGVAIQKLNLSRFALALSYAIDSGIEIHRSLKIALDTVTNLSLQEKLKQISPAIRSGESLANALRQSGASEGVAEGLLTVGESSGKQVAMLQKLHEYYFDDFRTLMMRVGKVLPTIAFVLVALLVGVQTVNFHSSRLQTLSEM